MTGLGFCEMFRKWDFVCRENDGGRIDFPQGGTLLAVTMR